MDPFNKWLDENIEKYQFFEWKVTDLARNAYLKGVDYETTDYFDFY